MFIDCFLNDCGSFLFVKCIKAGKLMNEGIVQKRGKQVGFRFDGTFQNRGVNTEKQHGAA